MSGLSRDYEAMFDRADTMEARALAAEAALEAAESRPWIDCPDGEVCKACPCAQEDDVCFPGERLRADLAAANERIEELEGAILRHRGPGQINQRSIGSKQRVRDRKLYAVVNEKS